MSRTGLRLAGLLVLAIPLPAAAQMRPVQPVTVPSVVPLLARVCLPVAAGRPVEAGIAAAKSQGFALTGRQGSLATLEQDDMVINLAPASCELTLNNARSASFPHVDHELTGWLPRLGRYWAGAIEADAAGFNARKFRAGGHTVLVWEVTDEGERSLNISIGK
jgi:hypothetical protein